MAVPLYVFFLLKRQLPLADAAAVSATYGSISAVTFVTATSYLDSAGVAWNGYLVAAMALTESPAIIIGPAGKLPLTGFIDGLFTGVLCLFLLDMGTVATRRIRDLKGMHLPSYSLALWALMLPVINAALALSIQSVDRDTALSFHYRINAVRLKP